MLRRCEYGPFSPRGSRSFILAPRYISELAPSPFRGRLVTIQTLLITGGQVVAYTVGWLFSAQAHGWRWMVGLGALPAVIQFFTLAYLPETPRWLVKANHADRARRVLRKVYGGAGGPADRVVDGVLRRIEKEILEEEEAAAGRAASSVSPSGPKHGLRARAARIGDTLGELVGPGRNRRALAIACMLQGFQQLCGFNSLMYFSATIFALVGFRSPVLTALSVAGTNFLFTLVAFTAIDRVGRRRILLYSVPVMVAGLVLCAVAFGFVELPGAGPAAPITVAHKGMKTWPLIILLAMIIYVAGYAVGLGCVPWQQSEYVNTVAPSERTAKENIFGYTFYSVEAYVFLQALPTCGPLPRLRARNGDKLGVQFHHRPHLSPNDGRSNPSWHIRTLRRRLRYLLAVRLAILSRDRRA